MGTVTFSDVAVAAVTVVLTEPRYTILLAGVVLKLLPFIVIEEFIFPDAGDKDVITGGSKEDAGIFTWLLKIKKLVRALI